MAVSILLPETTTNAAATQQGGIKPPVLEIPSMPAVTGGAQNYENRMAATTSLMQAGNGNLAGGGYRRRRNNVTKVMKGCNNKKTRRHNKKKRHNKRLFRGGSSSITPAVMGSKIELPVPEGASGGQIETLKSLTGGLLDLQTASGNIPPAMPQVVEQKFSGGGISRRRHRRTKYRRLRYKKSIGRRGRSRRHSGRH
jgi:hypothetical protein